MRLRRRGVRIQTVRGAGFIYEGPATTVLRDLRTARDQARPGRNLNPRRGERSPAAKMTDAQVAFIKRLLEGGADARLVARAAGVSVRAIVDIRIGNTWRHVEAQQ